MAQLWKIRMPDGKVIAPGDWTTAEPLYSTVEIGAGPFPVLTAFSYGFGGEIPGSPTARRSNLSDTNLQGEGARLPENEELIAYSLCIEAFMIGVDGAADVLAAVDAPDVSLPNMLRLQRDMVIVARIAYVKEYTRQPMSWFPAGTGVQQANAGARSFNSAGTVGYVAANNGGDQVCDQRSFASPLYIAGGESLAVDFKPGPGSITGLNIGAAGAGVGPGRIRLRTFFEGYRRRPVA